MSVVGKTIVITGASRGIGAAAARAFTQAGANVVLLARSGNSIAEIAQEIGETALAIQCDVSQFSEVSAAIVSAQAKFGAVDVLINNAGVVDPIGSLSESNPEEWARSIDINVKGAYHCIRAVMPHMLAAKAGTILNVGSGAAHGPMEGWSAYCTGKAATFMLTRATHLEGHETGLRVMGLSPGTVATDMQVKIKASGINPVSKLNVSDHVPAEWPAKALVWMCSPASDPHLGQELSLREAGLRATLGLE
ncbi:SDR family oxidoreductase [Falsihalocynthiibacter arcticus]|uniref:Short-chain dehydrogenase n=1 Tax=Falsihalocynthiibacter arcticus TaxID=1579316 RepID=A0A126UXL6_9RHOB|nr:SDR family oxidoreductase [Falsihalocynthiibacter arcticus]AML50808.1 short-chain dehydrogenase [Falsihalocynthiibacter arcticus]